MNDSVCQAFASSLSETSATDTSTPYQGRNITISRTAPDATAIRSPTPSLELFMAATLRSQAAATAAPEGSSKRPATSCRISSMASVAGER